MIFYFHKKDIDSQENKIANNCSYMKITIIYEIRKYC